MLTNKNGPAHPMSNMERQTQNFLPPRFALCTLLLALGFFLAGCTPAGPRALLQGKRLLDRGDTAEAIDKLKTATSLLSSNAQAWNYLGVAYQRAGQPNEAAEAYKRAITYDQNLIEVRYNLGCLWLEQNRPDLAKPELTAYTLRRDKSPEGWLKLGDAQLRSREIVAAEKSFNQVRLLDAQNPEALNGLGVAQMQRNRPADAAQFFNAALKSKPDYAPALLNLAIVSQSYLNNKQYALQRYQDYLAVTPRPANWDVVNAAARALEQELAPASAAAPAVAARPAMPTNTIATTPTPQTPPKPAAVPPRIAAKPEAPATKPSAPPAQAPPQQVVNVSPEPMIKAARDTAGSVSEPVVVAPSSVTATTTNNQKRGFFSRMFKTNSKTIPAEQGKTSNAAPAVSASAEPAPEPKFPRYSYHTIKKPQAGDHAAAEKSFAQAVRDQQAGDLNNAIQNYKKAVQSDPDYFDAYYNLGLASGQAGSLPQALTAYETALVIQPDSHDARFNFALTLKRANYPVDAANELEKLLTKSPNDANAHYAAGTIYAQSLHQIAKAREHYQKTLEIDPTIPQAVAIHDWLFANPH